MSSTLDNKEKDVDLEALSIIHSSTSSTTLPHPDYNNDNSDNASRHNTPSSKTSFKIDEKVVYDAILGLSDGLTVPFALTAGLASIGTTHLVILGGLAELVAGAISMGLGGFIGAKSEVESYQTSSRKCHNLITTSPTLVHSILQDHFGTYSLPSSTASPLINHLLSPSQTSNLHAFLLTNHFCTSPPSTSRPYTSALTLGLSYFLGGFLALIPYFCVRNDQVLVALWWSIGIMAVVMLVFGYVKTCVVRGWKGGDNVKAGIRGAVQMLVVGALAVGCAVGLVRAIEGGSGFRPGGMLR